MLVGGTGLSAVGTHITFIALPFHLRHSGPYVISAVMMASLVPVALGGPAAGWLVDRFPNRRIAAAAQLVAGGTAAAMVPALDTLPVLLALLAVMGATAAVTAPAVSALLPRLTGEDRAMHGYSALATARSAGTLAGLGLGGLLASGPGVRVALLADAVSFLVLAAALAAMRAERDPRQPSGEPAAVTHGTSTGTAGGTSTGNACAGNPPATAGSAPSGIAGRRRHSSSALAGLRWMHADRVLFAAIVGTAFAVVLAVLVNVADVYFVTEVLHGGGLAYGVIAASWGAGMIVGARLASRLHTDRRLAVGLFGCGVALGVLLVVPAAFPSVAVTVTCWVFGGACNAAQNVAIQGLIRSRVPDELRGRAFAGMNSALVTATVLGTFAGGPATAVFGPRAVFATAGVGTALSAAAALAAILRRLPPPAAVTAQTPPVVQAPPMPPPARAAARPLPAAPMDPPGAVVRAVAGRHTGAHR